MTKSPYAIEVSDLRKSYKKTEVLKGVSFKLKRGTMLALLGPNGAGKTTTVRILSTLLGYDGGTVKVEGHDVRKFPDKVRSVIGLTGQSAAIDDMLTGRENLVMMGRLYRLTAKSAKARAEELLADFELTKAADRPAKTYSGGMRRRLDLAVSLIAVPPVIFLDEPPTGLDPRSRIAMWEVIRGLMKQATTIFLTTQYLEEADQLADNTILIDHGKVAAEGTAKQLKAQIGQERLELTFTNLSQYNLAAKALSENTVYASDKDELMIALAIHDTNKDVQKALAALETARVTIDTMSLHKPSLDDVFLSITENKSSEGEDA